MIRELQPGKDDKMIDIFEKMKEKEEKKKRDKEETLELLRSIAKSLETLAQQGK